MKQVVYSCPYIPAEWIAAHGFQPCRVLPNASSAGQHAGVETGICPYVPALLGELKEAGDAAATILTTTCDQMRRAPDLLSDDYPSPVFLMHVPTTWQTVESQKYYISELKRLGKFLERQGGTAPTDERLMDTMRRHDDARSTLRNARGFLSARGFAEAIEHFNRTGQVEVAKMESTPARHGISVALVGGALLRDHFRIFDVIEKAGGDVVLDATTSGERSLLPPFDRRALKDGPLMALANACFGGVPDAFRRPNSDLYRWLKRAFVERGIRGIIFRRYVWCDTWHGEMQRMKEWADIPLLDIESGGEVNPDGHLAARIFAFIEMLKSSATTSAKSTEMHNTT